MKTTVKRPAGRPHVPAPTADERLLQMLLDLFGRATPPPEAVDYVSALHFTDAEKQRLTDILQRNQDGRATAEEVAEADRSIKIGTFLSTLKTRLRTAAKKPVAGQLRHG